MYIGGELSPNQNDEKLLGEKLVPQTFSKK